MADRRSLGRIVVGLYVARRARLLLTALAVALGVTLVSSVVIEVRSVSAASSDIADQLAGTAELRVVGAATRGGLQPEAVDAIAATDGVRAAVPVVYAISTLGDDEPSETAIVVGVDCSVEEVLGDIGCDPEAVAAARVDDPPLVSPAVVARYPTGTLFTNTGALSLEGALVSADLDDVNGGMVLVLPLPAAQQRFARGDRVDAVLVDVDDTAVLADVRDRLEAAVGPGALVEPATAPDATQSVSSNLLPLLMLLGVLGLVASVILASNAVVLSVLERRRDLATLLALGARPKHLRRAVLVVCAGVGAVGGAGAAVLSPVLARPLVGAISAETSRVAGIRVGVATSLVDAGIAVFLGVAVGLLASIRPLRSLRDARLQEALQGQPLAQDSGPVHRLAGIAGLVAATVGLASAARVAGGDRLAGTDGLLALGGLALVLFGAFVALPMCTRVLLAVVARLSSARSAAASLASTDLLRDGARSAAVSVSVGVAVATGLLLGGLLPSIHAGAVEFTSDLVGDDVVVTALPFTNSAPIDSKLPPEVFDAITTVDGVGSVNRVYAVTVRTTMAPVAITSADRFVNVGGALRAGAVPEGDLGDGEAIIGAGLARARSLHPGDELVLDGVGAEQRFVVRGVWDSGDLGGNSVYVNRATLEAAWGPQPAQYAIVTPDGGTSPGELRSRLLASRSLPWVRVLSGDEVVSETSSAVGSFLRPFWFLVGGMLVVSLLTVALTVSLSIVQRTREPLTVEALGLTRRRLGRLVVSQSLVVTLCVCTVAVAIALTGLWPTTLAAGFLFGLEPPYRLALWPLLVTPLVGCVVSVLATWTGFRFTSRPSVTEAIAGGAS